MHRRGSWSTCVVAWVTLCGLGARVAAAEEPAAELVQVVVGLLSEKDKDLRALGLEQVRSELKGTAATRQFAAQLSKLPADAQAGLLSALADRGDAAARPALLELLGASPDEAVRVAAIGALGTLGDVADVPALVARLAKGSKSESAAARSSLVRLPGEAAPAAIVAQIDGAPAAASVALIEILAARRALGTIPDLLSAALGAHPAVRQAAMAALGQLASAEHVPGMAQGVLKAPPGPERDAAERAVALVCSRAADLDRRAAPLLAAMDKLPAGERTALLPTLGRVGGAPARQAVEAAVAAAEPAVHEMGLRALCNWPDATISARLLELAAAEPHAEHRALALGALIRVAPLPDQRPPNEKLGLLKQALAMCSRDEDRSLVLKRARAIRSVDTLRFLLPYLARPEFTQPACESIVELAHHRELREANKAEFHRALDQVIAVSRDPVVVERANRYKKNQTWARPKPADAS